MDTKFYNVTITVYAKTPKEAYTKLCNALATDPSIEFETDTYDTEDAPYNGLNRSTEELFPEERCPCDDGRPEDCMDAGAEAAEDA